MAKLERKPAHKVILARLQGILQGWECTNPNHFVVSEYYARVVSKIRKRLDRVIENLQAGIKIPA
jgi:hypothetical protein